MEEQKLLRRQFFLHIVYNMIAFAMIFVVFGIFMFAMVRSITFSSVDKQLKDAKNEFKEMNVNLGVLYSLFDLKGYNIDDNGYNIAERSITKKINNPRDYFNIKR